MFLFLLVLMGVMRIRAFLRDFEAYAWEESSFSIAERFGLRVGDVIRFDLNTSPYRPVKWLNSLSKILPNLDVNEYPDTSYSSLRDALSDYTGFGADRFVITNGADEALDIIAKAFLDNGDEAVISIPTYSYFRIVSEIMGARVVNVPRRGDFSDNVEEILNRVSGRTKLIFLCSPNNPTGNLSKRGDVVRLLEESNAVVVVDEAYYEFSGETLAPLTDNYDNLIIVRTLSKAFSLAGARVGYIIASEESVKWLNKVRPPNSLSVISLALAEIALRDTDTLRKIVDKILRERDECYERLKKVEGIHVYPSNANFLLMRIEKLDANILHEKLMSMGFVLRNLTGVKGLENCLRMTIHSPENNEKLINALSKIMAGG